MLYWPMHTYGPGYLLYDLPKIFKKKCMHIYKSRSITSPILQEDISTINLNMHENTAIVLAPY